MDNTCIKGLFTIIDQRDAEAFAALFAHDGEFRFANHPACIGRAAIQAAVGAFFDSIAALQLTVEELWQVDNTLLMRGTVTYTRHDSHKVSLPFANIIKGEIGAFQDYRIFADVTPLYAEI